MIFFKESKGDVSENTGVNTGKTQKGCPSLQAMKKTPKIVRINVFRILEISESLAAIHLAFSQEKQLNLNKHIKLCSILT